MIPPRSVLAATDFSDASRAAVTFAACLAKQCEATLHLVHALDPLLEAAARHAGIDLARDTREALQELVASDRPSVDYAPMHHVVSGPAAEAIVAAAAREGADVIVVGSHGMSGAERVLFGSTTEGVLRRARTSVLVVPPGWKPRRADAPDLSGLGPIVAAIDFCPPSIEAAAAAGRLAHVLHTTLEAVHVVPEMPVPERWRAHAEAARRERIEAGRRDLAAVVVSLGSHAVVHTRVESGHVAERLAEAAAWTGDRRPLLVLGHRRGKLGAAPGAIAYRTLVQAQVPVLMYVSPE